MYYGDVSEFNGHAKKHSIDRLSTFDLTMICEGKLAQVELAKSIELPSPLPLILSL